MKAIPQGVHLTLQHQYRKCGNKGCRCAVAGKRHGPFWYAYWRDPGARKLRSVYIGKTLPPEIAAQAKRKMEVTA